MKLSRFNLFVAFAFTVMADPVSSIAYAVEAALRALNGDLTSLVATMGVVVGIVVVVSLTYHQLIGRFPAGGGGAASVATAFGESWSFLPLGALLVDFTLTVAVSCSAAAAALIAYVPAFAGSHMPIALLLAVAVGVTVLGGHRGRIGFALATQAFILMMVVIVAGAIGDASPAVPAASPQSSEPMLADASLAAVLIAFPLGMALATGVEAPSDAIAQLPQLDDRGRRRFGRGTLWLMVAIVGTITMAVAALAVHFNTGLPDKDSTLLADVARQILGNGPAFGFFQVLSALLLLAAAASSYLAGSGVLKALSGVGRDGGGGLLPERLHRQNRFMVPHWGVLVVLAVAAAMIIAARGREQALVQFYAVSVFATFLAATLACARLSHRDGRHGAMAVNLTGAALVALVLGLNVMRLDSAVALLASLGVAMYLWRAWVRRGKPDGTPCG